MLEALFESQIKEKLLLYLYVNESSYGGELARNFQLNLYTVQNQLKKLELGGVIYSELKGSVRLFKLNPRYPFQKELSALLEKLYQFTSQENKDRYYIKRTRPRKPGKPL